MTRNRKSVIGQDRPEPAGELDRPKILFLDSVFLLAGVVAFGMGLVRLQTGDQVLGLIDIVFAAMATGLLVYLHRHKDRVETVGSAVLVLSFVLFYTTYLLAPQYSSRLSLFFLLSASAFFLKNRSIGRIWLAIIIVAIIAGHILAPVQTAYSHLDILTISIYLIAMLFILENYETFKEGQQASRQELLRLTEERWRLALEGSGDAVWDWDVQSDELRCSPRFAEMLGYGEQELGRFRSALLPLVHPQDAAGAAAELDACLQGTKEEYAIEQRLRCRDGSWKWMLSRGKVTHRDAAGRPLRMSGTQSDISDRKRAEAALHDSEAKFHTMVDWTYDWEYWIGPDGRFIYSTPSVERITGYRPDEFEADPGLMNRLAHPEDRRLCEQHLSLVGEARREVTQIELRIVKKNGEVRWASHTCRPVFDDEGRYRGRRVTVRDVTEGKQAEDRIRTLNNELEDKVRERTRQLLEAQEDLVRKEKLAVLGQVAGSVGHELRNPLGVMSNAVYFLETVLSDADDTVREYLAMIKSEIADAERIVSDLLDSVRTKPPQPQPVRLDELICQTLGKLAVPAGVKVERHLPAGLPPVIVDPLQMQQVFRNLVSNAIDAMANGGTLEIRAAELAGEQAVAVSVRDTGCGIARDQMARLFQPLFTTKARGIGLGLVVVKNLTEANGGKVDVQSEPDKGATFTVTLPVCRHVA